MSMLRLSVNGRTTLHPATPRTHLADHLRDGLDLTGTHLGCEQGACGACTVLVDDVPVRGCLVRAVECEGSTVRTIEGFDDDAVMTALRAAFSRHHALQCGYCTPGMLITARDIVLRLGEVPEPRVREELAGNLCRCTGYQGIVEAVVEVARGRMPQLNIPIPPLQREVPRPAAVAPPRPDANAAPRPSQVIATDSGGAGVAESFVVDAPPDAVFAVLADPRRVVACLPGAEITAWDGNRLEMRMRVALGPIRVAITGHGEASSDPATRSGRLSGQGRDGGTGSGVSGEAAWQVVPQGAGSLVTLSLHWRLSGALAGFSRGGLLRDMVGRMVRDFGVALSAVLAGAPPIMVPPPSVLGMIFASLRNWITARFNPRSGGRP